MRAVVTRVNSASVTIGGRVEGAIERGFLVLLGVGPQDTQATCDKLAEKICNLRVFEDEQGKMNLNLEQVGGSLRESPSSPCTPTPPPAAPASPAPPSRSWLFSCMSGFWSAAGRGVSGWNTDSSGPTCRWLR